MNKINFIETPCVYLSEIVRFTAKELNISLNEVARLIRREEFLPPNDEYFNIDQLGVFEASFDHGIKHPIQYAISKYLYANDIEKIIIIID